MEQTIGLSRRLRAAAACVRPGAAVADVGCDHGKLGAYLLQTGAARFVTATDIHEQPLQKARALFALLDLEDSAKTVLCDGLAGVDPALAEDVVMAGIGADTILAVLDATPYLRDAQHRLILVPASHHGQLRAGLCARGYAIARETAVCEAGHCYSVMLASWQGGPCEADPVFCALGKMENDGPDARAYLLHEREKAQKLLASGADEDKRESAGRILNRIEELL